MGNGVHVVWFKRDLRVADHPALAGAAAAAGGRVLPLYIVEPGLWAEADAAGRHWDFVAECLGEVRDALGALGQPLVVRHGDAVAVLDAVRAMHGIVALWSHQETGNAWTYARDRAVAAWARGHGIAWHEPVQNGVVRRLASRDGWAARFDRLMAAPELAAPRLSPLGIEPGAIGAPPGLAVDPCAGRQRGGRAAGERLLESFLSGRAQPYRRAMSAPGPGAVHCSRLSPHLAHGTLSLREVIRAVPQHHPDRGMAESLASFRSRLHWRDHFTQKLEDAPALEHRNLHPAHDGLRPEVADAARLAAFAAGETGIPFVDACLRCLHATGWMNFRMRAMLQAVASYHLWLPWRDSGMVLARLFTDYEPGIHWPQVQMQSGTTGINTVRIYNPVKQGLDQDRSGAFTRTWLPELAAVPDTLLQTPWAWEGAGRLAYPAPIVDHAAAAREAKARVHAVRRGDAYFETARGLVTKHGSRKRPDARPAPPRQLALDLGE